MKKRNGGGSKWNIGEKRGREAAHAHFTFPYASRYTIQNAKIEKERDGKKSACDLFFFFIGESLADTYGRVMCLLFFCAPVCLYIASSLPFSSQWDAQLVSQASEMAPHFKKRWLADGPPPSPPQKKRRGGKARLALHGSGGGRSGQVPTMLPFWGMRTFSRVE